MLVLLYSYLLGLCAEGIPNSMTHRETAKAADDFFLSHAGGHIYFAGAP